MKKVKPVLCRRLLQRPDGTKSWCYRQCLPTEVDESLGDQLVDETEFRGRRTRSAEVPAPREAKP